MPSIIAVSAANDQTIPRRQRLIKEWINLASAIAHRTHDREARAVEAFLNDRAVLALPRPDNDLVYIKRPGVKKGDALYIVPMISTDYWILPPNDYWRRYATITYTDVSGASEAEYYPPTHAIYLPGEWSRSDLQHGMVLLHEGLHAYDHLIKRENMPKPFWRRERNARLMEMRLIHQLAGWEFIAYLDSLAPEIEGQLQRHTGGQFFFDLSRELSDDALLDRLLWKASNPIEIRSRREDVERYAIIHYFERRYGGRKGHHLYGAYVRANYIAKAHPQHLRGLVSP